MRLYKYLETTDPKYYAHHQVFIYTMKTKIEAVHTLNYLINELIISKLSRTDQENQYWHGLLWMLRTHLWVTLNTNEPHSHWKNACGFSIG